MKLKFLEEYDIVNYKEASMFLGFPYCSFKCDMDNGCQYCQNWALKDQRSIEISPEQICEKYINNPLTHAIVIGGLEPFDSPFDLIGFIDTIRNKYKCKDKIIIYTGYTEDECNGISYKEYPYVNFEKVRQCFESLKTYKNIIIKFGRYIPNNEPHLDKVLGIQLASDNQYAKKIS